MALALRRRPSASAAAARSASPPVRSWISAMASSQGEAGPAVPLLAERVLEQLPGRRVAG